MPLTSSVNAELEAMALAQPNVLNFTSTIMLFSIFVIQKIEVDYEVVKTIVYNLITKQQIEFDSTSEIEIRTNYFTEEKNGKTNT